MVPQCRGKDFAQRRPAKCTLKAWVCRRTARKPVSGKAADQGNVDALVTVCAKLPSKNGIK
jgi:hypothetical protein